MSWMSPNMKMETTTNGGIGKAFGRMFSGEHIFQNIYTAEGGNGMIAFASCFGIDQSVRNRTGTGRWYFRRVHSLQVRQEGIVGIL